MIRLVFVSCLLFILSSCGVAGLAFTAASGAKDVYEGYKYAEKNDFFQKKSKRSKRNTWYQIHEDGIWYGSYIMIDRKNYRIYGNPRDKERYETTKPTIR